MTRVMHTLTYRWHQLEGQKSERGTTLQAKTVAVGLRVHTHMHEVPLFFLAEVTCFQKIRFRPGLNSEVFVHVVIKSQVHAHVFFFFCRGHMLSKCYILVLAQRRVEYGL